MLTLASSVFACRHFRVSVLDPTVDPSHGTEMFELASLGDQHFGCHRAYSSYTMSLTLACHCLEQGQDSDVSTKDRSVLSSPSVLVKDGKLNHLVFRISVQIRGSTADACACVNLWMYSDCYPCLRELNTCGCHVYPGTGLPNARVRHAVRWNSVV